MLIGLLAIWLISTTGLWLVTVLVPGFEVASFGDALLAAVIMAQLAIAGFIFLQWFLFDAVFWLQTGSGHPRFGE